MKDNEWEIDFWRMWDALRRGAPYILALALEGAVAAVLALMLLLTPQYQSTAVFYVKNNTPAIGAASAGGISSADIAASKELVASYIVILQARETLEEVLCYAGVEGTYEDMREKIHAASVNSTEFFEVVVTSPDPQEAQRIANAIALILPQRISQILEGASAKIVDSAIAEPEPQNLGYGKAGALGALAGLLFGAVYACAESVLDTAIRRKEDIAKCCPYPVLAVIPEKRKAGSGYTLLRAKVEYLMKETRGTRILGITSSLRGERKNQTAENLTRSLTKRGKQVLLIDCDLRASRLVLPERRSHPLGLAEYLAGTCELEAVIQRHAMEKARFSVIPAGRVREDFAELLSSEKMTRLLESLQGKYDYVILNLPVLAEAGDCLPLIRELQGITLVVRRDICRAEALCDGLRQLEFVQARILGVVYQDVRERGGKSSGPSSVLAGIGAGLRNRMTRIAGMEPEKGGEIPSALR